MGKTEMENKNGKQKWKAKKWMARILAAALCMAVPMQTEAAQAEPLVVTTTQQCSIWSMPATTEENRMKYVDEGYQIMVYPEVIQSGLGDGKTFYRTVKGAYVLCRCVTGGESSSAAAGENESGFAVVFPIMPSLPEFDNVEKIVSWELKPWMGGYLKYGYDAAGHAIRSEYLEADRTTVYKIDTAEYDPAGRWEVSVNYEPDGRIPDFMGTLWFREFDETGNQIRTTTFEAETGRPLEVDEYDPAGHMIMNTFYSEDGIYQRYFDSEGKGIKSVQYNADGTVSSYHISEYDAAGNRIRSTTYHSNGTIKEDMISEYNEEGREIRRTTYDGSGAVVEVLEEDDIYITPGRTK